MDLCEYIVQCKITIRAEEGISAGCCLPTKYKFGLPKLITNTHQAHQILTAKNIL